MLRRFDDPADDPVEPLDSLEDPDAEFGSYVALIEEPRFRYSLE